MPTFKLRLVLSLVAASAFLCGGMPHAFAAPGDFFTPFVTASVTRDDNFFRLSDGTPTSVVGASSRSDVITSEGVGANLDWKLSRQQFLLTGTLTKNQFENNKRLDYLGKNLSAIWNWQLGNHVNGDLGYNKSTSLGSFVDFRGLVGNLREQERVYFDGKWLFHPRWQFGLGLSNYKTSFGSIAQSAGNREEDSVEFSIKYLNPSKSTIGLLYRTQDIRFPDSTDSIAQAGSTQKGLYVTGDWMQLAHHTFSGQVGAIQRNNDATTSPWRLNGRVSWGWLPTSKLSLNTALYLETGIGDTVLTNYTQKDGILISPTWNITSKISITGSYRLESREFLVGDFGATSGTARKDKFNTISLGLNYQPTQHITIGASLINDERTSNRSGFDYTDNTLGVNAQISM